MVDTIPQRFLDQAKTRPDRPGYFVKDNGVWHATSWQTYVREVVQAARALIALGFQPGQRVCILGLQPARVGHPRPGDDVRGRRARGHLHDLLARRGRSTSSHHSEAPLILVENAAQAKKVEAKRAELPHLKHVVAMKSAPKVPGAMSWEDFLARGDATPEKEVYERVGGPRAQRPRDADLHVAAPPARPRP